MDRDHCPYGDEPNGPDGWDSYPAECFERASKDFTPTVPEYYIVGGLHPRWRLGIYIYILKALMEAFPMVHLMVFTEVEIFGPVERDQTASDNMSGNRWLEN